MIDLSNNHIEKLFFEQAKRMSMEAWVKKQEEEKGVEI